MKQKFITIILLAAVAAVLAGCGGKPTPPKRISIDRSLYPTIEDNLTIINYDYYGNALGLAGDRSVKAKYAHLFTSRVDYMWAKKCSKKKLIHMKEFYGNRENLKEWQKFYSLLRSNKKDEYKAGILKIRDESCKAK